MTVRRDSLATILPLVEDGLLKYDDMDDVDLAELQAGPRRPSRGDVRTR